MKVTTDLFILGAGASKSYGFPTGAELREYAIAELVAGNNSVMAQTVRLGQDLGYNGADVMEFRTLLEQSFRNHSIDAFIESQVNNPKLQTLSTIAKVVIAILIMRCEDDGNLSPESSWYARLFDKLYDGNNSLDRFFENKIQFITFNYDRSLERYLQKEVSTTFPIDENEAARRLGAQWKVLHPHGSLGEVWSQSTSEGYKAYDAHLNDADVLKAANKVRLITDNIDIDQDPIFLEARRLILDADRVHFIGFGYHPNNMSRLGFHGTEMQNMSDDKLFGTVSGISDQKKALFFRQYKLNRMVGRNSTSYSLAHMPDDNDRAFQYLELAPFD